MNERNGKNTNRTQTEHEQNTNRTQQQQQQRYGLLCCAVMQQSSQCTLNNVCMNRQTYIWSLCSNYICSGEMAEKDSLVFFYVLSLLLFILFAENSVLLFLTHYYIPCIVTQYFSFFFNFLFFPFFYECQCCCCYFFLSFFRMLMSDQLSSLFTLTASMAKYLLKNKTSETKKYILYVDERRMGKIGKRVRHSST